MPESVEERLAKVEGRLEELSKRIDNLNHRITEGFTMTNTRIDDLGKSLNKRIDDLRSEVRLWFVVITIIISLITLLLKLIP
ncbi:MAG: hypothetical protein AOA65_2188 [Candidatus Bathyarchaeota archaeon BA1]|nr:MAG: hypothetical protein AOA65_2188 [Candidatus Bathyarchaeota archaeon BA1]